MLLFIVPAMAQVTSSSAEENGGQQNAIERIEQASAGNIVIDIPESLIEKILSPKEPEKKHSTNTGKSGYGKTNGYRIQVFSDGRNQTTLENRAKARGSAVLAKFPKYRGQVYSFSNAPNWYTRVGNFRSIAEANSALAELKRAFPQFAAEMRVVKSKISILK